MKLVQQHDLPQPLDLVRRIRKGARPLLLRMGTRAFFGHRRQELDVVQEQFALAIVPLVGGHLHPLSENP